jgi:hypothetical protein
VLGLAVALSLGPAPGCGRIGYDPLPAGTPPSEGGLPVDASTVTDAARIVDATADASKDAEEDAPENDEAGEASTEAGPVDSGPEAGCPVSQVADYCSAIPPLPAPPVIDGVLDCGPALVPMPPEDWSGPSPLPPFPDGNSAELAVAWRPDGLYIFMAVTTPVAFPADATDPVFYGAGVELFLDDNGISTAPPAYDNPGCIQLVVTAPPDPAPLDASAIGQRAEGFRNAADEGPWASTQFGTFPTSYGFVFEGFVVAADLGLTTWSLASGGQVGFDVSVDVSYTTASMIGSQGHRVGQYFLHVPPAPDGGTIVTPFQDPRSFCTPTLAPM